MSLVCAISGTTPECPVVTKSGYCFEKRILKKHLEEKGSCPITSEELHWDDVTEVAPSQHRKPLHPRNTATASIPGMLSLFQSEWDNVLNCSHELRKSNTETRTQLSHALYQHDAACRVIERLIRERDQARAQVAILQEQLAATQAPIEVVPPTREAGMTDDLKEKMKDVAKTLTAARRQRSVAGLTDIEVLKKAKVLTSATLHQASAPGILCLDLHPKDANIVLTGGVDGNVGLFKRSSGDQVSKLSGHTKRVLHVGFHHQKPNCAISTSMDATCRVWMQQEDHPSKWRTASTIKVHQSDVTEAHVHPCGDFFLTSSLDKSWAFHDMHSGQLIRHVQDQAAGITSINFHPDGLIVGTGMQNAVVALWDATKQESVTNLEGHVGPITSLSFSENGYYLATASRDKTVKLWDLRKPICMQTLELEAPVLAARFDKTGQYLACALGKQCDVYHFETRTNLVKAVSLEGHTDDVTDVMFGTNAKNVFSVSMDRCLKIWE